MSVFVLLTVGRVRLLVIRLPRTCTCAKGFRIKCYYIMLPDNGQVNSEMHAGDS